MKELGQIVSENLIFLRKKAGMTQLEFGEKFNYTDKTVSRWENGSIIPSVEVLKQIAEYYGVTVDYLISEHHSASEMSVAANKSVSRKNKAIIAGLLITVVWTVALVIYLANVLKSGPNNIYWKTFVWAVPLSLFLVAFFNVAKATASGLIVAYFVAFPASIPSTAATISAVSVCIILA